MNQSPRFRRGAALVVGLVVLVAAVTAVASAVPAGNALVVEDVASGDVLLTAPVHDGSNVTLSYMHSVQKSQVLDIYTVHGQTLDNTRMVFESYGWGLPAREKVQLVNGTFVFDPDWSGTELVVKPGHVAGHELIVDGRTYDLVAISDAKSVRLRVVHQSALSALLHDIDL